MNYSEFIEFLKETESFHEFNQMMYFSSKNIKDFFKSTEDEYSILDAFKWKDSQLGPDYWDDINDKLKQTLKEKLAKE